jgi:hypothetical protein
MKLLPSDVSGSGNDLKELIDLTFPTIFLKGRSGVDIAA